MENHNLFWHLPALAGRFIFRPIGTRFVWIAKSPLKTYAQDYIQSIQSIFKMQVLF